jgi:hypothetical protein
LLRLGRESLAPLCFFAGAGLAAALRPWLWEMSAALEAWLS